MAAIGIAAAGAALGGTLGSASLLGFGVQAGMSAGFLVGSILGQLIFASSGPTIKGPRLGDTKVQVSTYGVMITIVHGTLMRRLVKGRRDGHQLFSVLFASYSYPHS